ncbi:MAG: Rieske 2Fe-2S domain-containing protein [Meiothermus sp.]|nr:Rieske 2Fe-2S domain-containing protein [Meiothermus sp.]
MEKPDLKSARRITRRDAIWIIPAIISTGFFGWFVWRGWRINFGKAEVGEPVWHDGARAAAARVSELPNVWSKKYFQYPLEGGAQLEAVIFKLPSAVLGSLEHAGGHYFALSRICTHQGCLVNYVDNPELGSIAYNYRTDHPFMGCPCHFGAYEPLLSGRAVYGPPRYGLSRLRLEADGDNLIVTGHETPLRLGHSS